MRPTRRQIVQLLALVGLTTGPIARLFGQVRSDRFDAIRPALQKSTNEVADLRAFDVDDGIGMPVVFRPLDRRGR